MPSDGPTSQRGDCLFSDDIPPRMPQHILQQDFQRFRQPPDLISVSVDTIDREITVIRPASTKNAPCPQSAVEGSVHRPAPRSAKVSNAAISGGSPAFRRAMTSSSQFMRICGIDDSNSSV